MGSASRLSAAVHVLPNRYVHGRRLFALCRTAKLDWTAAELLARRAQPVLLANAEVLRGLLIRSTNRFRPLRDPLLIDYGVHKWLAHSREEAYSDWLAWVIEQLRAFPELLLGKTIEAGYILRELSLRQGGLERVLILVPARLKTKWKRELRDRLGETFEAIGSAELAAQIQRVRAGNQAESFHWIVSYESVRSGTPNGFTWN